MAIKNLKMAQEIRLWTYKILTLYNGVKHYYYYYYYFSVDFSVEQFWLT